MGLEIELLRHAGSIPAATPFDTVIHLSFRHYRCTRQNPIEVADQSDSEKTGSIMETSAVETYRTSPAGIRFQRNQTIALIGGVIAGNYLAGVWSGELYLGHTVTLTVLASLPLYLCLARLFGPLQPGMEVTVEPEYVELRKDGLSRRVPVAALRRIKILRSPKGTHRHVRIWDDENHVFALLDPEGGAILEQWAETTARQHGVSVKTTPSTAFDRSPWLTLATTAVIFVMAAWLANFL